MPAVTLDDLIRSWLIDLRGRNLSAKTVSTYGGAAHRLETGLPERCCKNAAEITREELRAYFASIVETRTPGGVSVDYRALQQFFKWADEVEEEITPNPMAKMRPPIVPDPETRVLRPEEIKACAKPAKGVISWPGGIWLSSASSWTPVCAGPSLPGWGPRMSA